MARLILFGSILALIVGGALTLYYLWWTDYYFPDRYEDALVLSTLGQLLVIVGVLGAIGSGVVLWLRRRA